MKKETLGQVLKRYREAADLKIEQVEKETKISRRMILAVENDNYADLPDELYTKNIIRTYAKFLSLDYNKLLVLYEQDKKKPSKKEKNSKDSSKIRVYLTPQRIRLALIALAILILFIYLGGQLNQIFEAPELIVNQPAQDLIIDKNFIEIKGKTEKEARVFINEKEVFLDPQGAFKATLDLQKGLNIIKISAAKKHGKEKVIFREVLVR